MAPTVNLLFSGLKLSYSQKLNPQLDGPKFEAMLAHSLDTLSTIPSLHAHRFDLDPDSPESKAAFFKLLKDGPPEGGKWDAQLIGVGIRRTPALTGLFEEIINTISQSSQGQTRILFSTTGDDHYEAVKRNFPELNLGDKPKA